MIPFLLKGMNELKALLLPKRIITLFTYFVNVGDIFEVTNFFKDF
jgi:hypothetical protein